MFDSRSIEMFFSILQPRTENAMEDNYKVKFL